MRWTKQKTLRTYYGDNVTKVKEKFLWIPVTIDGETRWLERAKIQYRVKRKSNLLNDDYFYYFTPWVFLND